MTQHLVYILLGSNVGNKRKFLLDAMNSISEKIGEILKKSSIYRTAAWGNTNQAAFYNQVILVKTNLTANKTLSTLLSIELQLGRVRVEKMGPRTIDLDILYFDDEAIDTKNLTVPHPEIQNRKFVLKPLVEIAPEFIHCKLKLSNLLLLKNCTDKLAVRKIT